MKYGASWWGTWLIAEDEEDKTLLKQVRQRLPIDARGGYENGEVEFKSGAEFKGIESPWSSSADRITDDALVLVMNR